MKKEKKSVHVTFRMTESEYAPFEKLITELGLSKSDFFHLLCLKRLGDVDIKKNNKDYRKSIHFLQKSSNNLNQIAHRLNSDYLLGSITESTYKKSLNALMDIRDLLNVVVS